MRASVVTLIKEQIRYDSIGQAIKTESEREVMCRVASVSRSEWSEAGKLGIDPQVKLVTPYMNYNGERTALFEGKRYGIYRAYTAGDQIELYLERKAGKDA